MTRTHAALKLLEHGPLTWAEFVAITGWPRRAARKCLNWLIETGRVVFAGRMYQRAEGTHA